MGRSLYTPSTLIHLYKEAGVAPPLLDSRSASPSRTSSPVESEELDGNKSMNVEDFQASYNVAAQYAVAKDAPMPWRVSAFDPNDDELPVVTERFIDPAEVLPCPHYLDSLADGQQHEGDETVIDEDDYEEDEEDEENEDEEAGDEDIEEGDEVDDRSMYELEEDGVEVEEEMGRAEYLRAVESVHHDLAAPAIPPSQQTSFSPSMGVFHSHTLPLVLPSRGEIQLMHQERRSSNGSNTARTNA